MAAKVLREVTPEVLLHVAKYVVLEMLEQVVKVEVEVPGLRREAVGLGRGAV